MSSAFRKPKKGTTKTQWSSDEEDNGHEHAQQRAATKAARAHPFKVAAVFVMASGDRSQRGFCLAVPQLRQAHEDD